MPFSSSIFSLLLLLCYATTTSLSSLLHRFPVRCRFSLRLALYGRWLFGLCRCFRIFGHSYSHTCSVVAIWLDPVASYSWPLIVCCLAIATSIAAPSPSVILALTAISPTLCLACLAVVPAAFLSISVICILSLFGVSVAIAYLCRLSDHDCSTHVLSLRRSATPTALRLLFGPFKFDQAGFPVVSSAVIRLLPSLAIPVGSRSGHYCFSQAFHWLVSVWLSPSSSSVSPILFRRHHCSCRRLSSRRHRSSPYLAIPAVLDVVQLLQSLYSRCLAILAALTVSVVLVFLVVSRTTHSCTRTLSLTTHLNIRLLRILLRRPLAQHHCVAFLDLDGF